MARSDVLTEYTNAEGYLVTVYKPRKARKSERTWRSFSKYSIYQIGHQAASMGTRCARATVDRIGQHLPNPEEPV